LLGVELGSRPRASGALSRHRRGSLLAEVAMSCVVLMIGMALTVKLLGYVAVERREAVRRQHAIVEVDNLMEQLTGYPYGEVTPELARAVTLSESARQSLPDPELKLDISESPLEVGRSAKRIAISLRWRDRAGEWQRPVRLTSWIERGRANR
jgi:hypothetical protein